MIPTQKTRGIFLDAIDREVVTVLYYIEEGLPATAATGAERLAQYAFELHPELRKVAA